MQFPRRLSQIVFLCISDEVIGITFFAWRAWPHSNKQLGTTTNYWMILPLFILAIPAVSEPWDS